MATGADEIEDLNSKFLNFMLSTEDVEMAIEEIYDDLVDEVLIGFVFDVHRSAKLGIDEAEEGIVDESAYQIVDAPGLDVFGEPMTRKTGKCSCPNCDHIVSANRFATHLERCLGMGRNSSRAAAASRRSNGKLDRTLGSGDENNDDDDNDDDDDWSRNNKKRRRKNATKKQQQQATKRPSSSLKDDSEDVSTSNSPTGLS